MQLLKVSSQTHIVFMRSPIEFSFLVLFIHKDVLLCQEVPHGTNNSRAFNQEPAHMVVNALRIWYVESSLLYRAPRRYDPSASRRKLLSWSMEYVLCLLLVTEPHGFLRRRCFDGSKKYCKKQTRSFKTWNCRTPYSLKFALT